MNKKNINQKSPELPITDFTRIQSIFERNKWPIQDYFDDYVFDDFCNMLKGLEPEQRELIISLTENFIWIQDREYMMHFSYAFDSFVTTYDFSRGKNIYICPLLPEDDFGKSKSSISLLYTVKSHLRTLQRKYKSFNITYADSPHMVDFDLLKNNYTLCLIDDFIGTGETVERAVDYFLKKEIPINTIVVVSLVAMKFGIYELQKKGYTIYTHLQCDKGLSSSGNERNIEIMKTIEQQIKVSDEYRFGYKGSEALVKLIRTPNNTFPIYWFRNKKNKYAPFAR